MTTVEGPSTFALSDINALSGQYESVRVHTCSHCELSNSTISHVTGSVLRMRLTVSREKTQYTIGMIWVCPKTRGGGSQQHWHADHVFEYRSVSAEPRGATRVFPLRVTFDAVHCCTLEVRQSYDPSCPRSTYNYSSRCLRDKGSV